MAAEASWTSTAPCHSSSALTAARPRGRTLALGWAGFTYSHRWSGFRGLPRPRVVLFFFEKKLLYNHRSSSSPTSASSIMRPLKPSVSSGQRACWKIRGLSFLAVLSFKGVSESDGTGRDHLSVSGWPLNRAGFT